MPPRCFLAQAGLRDQLCDGSCRVRFHSRLHSRNHIGFRESPTLPRQAKGTHESTGLADSSPFRVAAAAPFLSISISSSAGYGRKPRCFALRTPFWFFTHTRAFCFFSVVLRVDGPKEPPHRERPRAYHKAIKVKHLAPPPPHV